VISQHFVIATKPKAHSTKYTLVLPTMSLTPEGQKFRSLSIGEAAQETGDVEQWTPIGPATLLAGQITDIASKAAVV
jgi:hypothetical protein